MAVFANYILSTGKNLNNTMNTLQTKVEILVILILTQYFCAASPYVLSEHKDNASYCIYVASQLLLQETHSLKIISKKLEL